LRTAFCVLSFASCVLRPEPGVLKPRVPTPAPRVIKPTKHQTSSTLAWKNQLRVNGRFVSRPRADTITPNEPSLQSYESSLSSSPSTESSLTQSSHDNLLDGFLGLDNPFTESPLVPDKPPTTPSPQPQSSKKLLMPQEMIPEFAGTQDDTIQPTDFLKAIK
jgi:hypothetical protein